jgi:hypothetical protein
MGFISTMSSLLTGISLAIIAYEIREMNKTNFLLEIRDKVDNIIHRMENTWTFKR